MRLLKTLVFLFLIFLPFLAMNLGIDFGVRLNERRYLSGLPQLSDADPISYTKKYAVFFSDNFGFRQLLVKANTLFKINFLGVSGSEKVTIGKNGWFFYTPDINKTESLNLAPFTENELEQIRKNFEFMNKYFGKRDAKFYILIAPRAFTIYPESLPDNFKVGDISKLDQLTRYVQNTKTDVKFINPTKKLLQAKNLEHNLYYYHDLHWNYWGAYYAYQSLMEEVSKDFPHLKADNLEDFDVRYQLTDRKSLEDLVGLTGYYEEYEPVFISKQKINYSFSSNGCRDFFEKCEEVFINTHEGSKLKLLMFRDSYASWLIPFLTKNFSRSVYIWKPQPFSTQVFLDEKPDVVILELSEMTIGDLKGDMFSYRY